MIFGQTLLVTYGMQINLRLWLASLAKQGSETISWQELEWLLLGWWLFRIKSFFFLKRSTLGFGSYLYSSRRCEPNYICCHLILMF